MDFETQQKFHPGRPDLQPLPPGRGQLPSQPASRLKLQNSLFFALFICFLGEQRHLSLCAPGGPSWVRGDLCSVGAQDRKGGARLPQRDYGA